MHAHIDQPEVRRVSRGEHPLWDEALAVPNQDLGHICAAVGALDSF